jgi:hypothetical protein
MKLENGILYVTQQEYEWVRKCSILMASPYMAGYYLYHRLKNNNLLTLEWDQFVYRDVILAFRKKNVEIVD